MHKRVLHVELLGVVEDGDGITRLGIGGRSILIGHDGGAVLCDSGHGEGVVEGRIRKTEGFGFSGKAENHKKERATKSPEIKFAAIFCSRQCEVTVEVRVVKRGSFEVRATKNCLACLGSSVKAISDFTPTSTGTFTLTL